MFVKTFSFLVFVCLCSRYMDKKLSLKLNGGRCVQGILRGFDPFMNVVIDESQEICKDGKKNDIGMVVRGSFKRSRLALN